MNQETHIVWEMTVNGIVDVVLVYPLDEVKDAMDATRERYFHRIAPNRRLLISACECDDPDSYKDEIGHWKS